jgi:phage gp37-like protein
MSIADAVRARDLEARVAALEQRTEESTNAELDTRLKLLQGQLNSLRAKVDRLIPPGPPGTSNAA